MTQVSVSNTPVLETTTTYGVGYGLSTEHYIQSFSVGSQDANPQGMALNNDGTKMYMAGVSNTSIYSYTLSTAYDISTATYNQSFSVGSQDGDPNGMAWNNEGTERYMDGEVNN